MDGQGHILRVAQIVEDITYHQSSKGWMDKAIFSEWLRLAMIFKPLPNFRKHIFYAENFSVHKLTPEVVDACFQRSCTELQFTPECTTYFVQTADFFGISTIKDDWRNRWDVRPLYMIRNKMWVNRRSGSGRLVNPDKRYFLKLASDAVHAVGRQRGQGWGVIFEKGTHAMWHGAEFEWHMGGAIAISSIT